MSTTKTILVVLAILGAVALLEARNIYVKPHPTNGAKRSVHIASQLGEIQHEFPNINGFVIEVSKIIGAEFNLIILCVFNI